MILIGTPRLRTRNARGEYTFGWPATGAVVFVTKFKPFLIRPEGCSRTMDFALDMEERIMVMLESGAEFVEDVGTVKEMKEPWLEDVYVYNTEGEEGDTSSSSAAVSLSDF